MAAAIPAAVGEEFMQQQQKEEERQNSGIQTNPKKGKQQPKDEKIEVAEKDVEPLETQELIEKAHVQAI